ncbi:MAG: AsmA family protein, partial [Burkholderiales bacterium]|nr:AsmA family protein [Burkholderiales bacterium]
KPAARDYVFPETPVSFAPLRWADADAKIAIAKLTLRDGHTYDNLRLRFTIDNGRLNLSDFAVTAFGGTLGGTVVVDAGKPDATSIALRIDGKGLSLGELLAAAGQPRQVRGGSTDVALNLALRGNSPHAWASSASGSVRAVSGPATLLNSKLEMVGAWDKIGEAVNPFRTRDPSTELVCLVVRFPVSNGIARVDHGIALETSKLGVSASGTLDFRNETLDFTFQPKVKKGISIDFAGLTDLVRVTGPFTSPRMAVDAAGSAKVIASVGAAISTSGLSAVAQGLLSWADGSGPGPCQIALGAAPAQAKTGGATVKAPVTAITNEVGKALGKLFGR